MRNPLVLGRPRRWRGGSPESATVNLGDAYRGFVERVVADHTDHPRPIDLLAALEGTSHDRRFTALIRRARTLRGQGRHVAAQDDIEETVASYRNFAGVEKKARELLQDC